MESVTVNESVIRVNLVNPTSAKVRTHIRLIDYMDNEVLIDLFINLRTRKPINIKCERGLYVVACDIYNGNVCISSVKELVRVSSSKMLKVLKTFRRKDGWRYVDDYTKIV